jgi:hypothetical protein
MKSIDLLVILYSFPIYTRLIEKLILPGNEVLSLNNNY